MTSEIPTTLSGNRWKRFRRWFRKDRNQEEKVYVTNESNLRPDDLLKYTFDAWQQTVQVQMHFNDLCLRIRTLALTALTFTFGATFTALRYASPIHVKFWFVNFTKNPAILVAFVGILIWWNFFQLDANWYHLLLRGSVTEGKSLENQLKSFGINANLGYEIKSISRRKKYFWVRGKNEVTARQKLYAFYTIWGGVLIVLFFYLLVKGSVLVAA